MSDLWDELLPPLTYSTVIEERDGRRVSIPYLNADQQMVADELLKRNEEAAAHPIEGASE